MYSAIVLPFFSPVSDECKIFCKLLVAVSVEPKKKKKQNTKRNKAEFYKIPPT
jgi:hypothetical protein